MAKEELEKYANENRKRLGAQKVKIGDVVKVLRGRFAGETGVVVGIIACGNDYTDPYYEVNMDCEVPDKYKCRKNLAQSNNVIGGLSAYEFEVIGNRIPSQPTAPKIKVGDMVRCKTPLRLKNSTDNDFIGTVTDAENEWFVVHMNNGAVFQTNNTADLELVQPKEQTEAEEDTRIRQIEAELDEFRKAELDRVLHPEKYYTYEVTIDNVAVDWLRYEADIAKEIAVKLSKPNENKPGYVADYAVSVAKAVVENLKKK